MSAASEGVVMAFDNDVRLFARVIQKPLVRMDENGNPFQIETYLHVLRGRRDFGLHFGHVEYQIALVVSTDDVIIKKMQGWDKNDFAYIHGYLSTADIVKQSWCPNKIKVTRGGVETEAVCGAENSKSGTLVYVNPINAYLLASGLTEEASMAMLRNCEEESNSVKLVGRLCKDPEEVNYKAGVPTAKYMLAIKRSKFFKNEPSDWDTDFPVVRSYGDIAVKDLMALRQNSVVMIDGYLQSRQVKQKTICSSCGQEYEWDDLATEVVPYRVEYLKNCQALLPDALAADADAGQEEETAAPDTGAVPDTGGGSAE